MRLAAISFGYGVSPSDLSGHVVAVFARACAILRPDGAPITLVVAAAGNLPGGIVIETPVDFDFSTSLVIGMEATLRGGILRFTGSALMIDLRPARPWRSGLPSLRLDLANGPALDAWRAAAALLRADGRAMPLLGLASNTITALVDASRDMDLAAARGAAERLIGLGDGVTPAGDDYLVGQLAGLWATAGADATRTIFVKSFGSTIAALAPRTHRASRTYLEAAAIGETSERLTNLAVVIAVGSRFEARAAAASAIAMGHSSGACGVLGLLVGSAIWSSPDLAAGLIAAVSSFQSRAGVSA